MSESKENFRNISKWKDYLKHNGKLHIATPKFLHHKFCIIDNNTINDQQKEFITFVLMTGDENSPLIDNVKLAGVKVAFQYNYFQIFANFRDVHGNDSELPVKGFGGFRPNIGVVFNAQIVER